MNKFRLNHTIKSYETDSSGQVSLSNLLYFFQEAANQHATALDWGFEYLESVQKFWVLTRLKINIQEYPVHKDQIEIVTWSRGAEGFFAFRDYQVIKDNHTCIDGVSSWMILDKNTHRPCRIEQLGKEIPAITESYLPFPETKVPALDEKELIFEKIVRHSDIDINLHVNNGKYAEILTDALAASSLNPSSIEGIDIQFQHESQINDCLKVYCNKKPATHEVWISVMNETKNKETCKCILRFNPDEAIETK